MFTQLLGKNMYVVFETKNAAVCDVLILKAFIAAETPTSFPAPFLLSSQHIIISLKKSIFFKAWYLCNLCMAPPTFIIHRVVLWIAQHIVVSFSLDADFFLVAWDGVGSVVVVKKAEKMWRKTLRMLSSVTLYCQITMSMNAVTSLRSKRKRRNKR